MRGSHTDDAAEQVGEVALVAEPRGQRDLRQRHVGVRQPAARELDPEPAHVRADRAAVAGPEAPGESDRVDADRLRQAREADARRGVGVDEVAGGFEPCRGPARAPVPVFGMAKSSDRSAQVIEPKLPCFLSASS